MKIAIFHELQMGGGRRTVNEFAKRLKKNNTVDLYIVDNTNRTEENRFYSNVYFYRFVEKKWQGGNWKVKLYKDTIEIFKLFLLHKKVARGINDGNYDIAFIHSSKYTQAPFILNFIDIPKLYYSAEVLRMAYESGFEINSPFPKNLYEKLIRKVKKEIDLRSIKKSDLVIANSYETQKNLRKAYGIKCTVVQPGVDTKFFKPTNLKKNIDVLYVGAPDERDGHLLLKDALALSKRKINATFFITGGRWISDRKLMSMYTRSKVVVCLAENEPFGLIPLEAMASGACVIALESGGYKETIIEGVGFLIPRDTEVLKSHIETITANKSLRDRVTNKANKYIKEYWDWDRRVEKLEEVIRRYCEK